MGPLLDMEAADRLTDSFLYLMSNGGKPIRHMRRPINGLPFVTPGIIDVTDMAKRPDVEHFGPLLQIIRVADFEEAIALANDTRYGLSAALIGGTPEHFDYFLALSKSGIVNWNRPTTATPLAAPLGGTGLSGNHRPGGTYAADACAYPVVSAAIDQPRAVMLEWAAPARPPSQRQCCLRGADTSEIASTRGHFAHRRIKTVRSPRLTAAGHFPAADR